MTKIELRVCEHCRKKTATARIIFVEGYGIGRGNIIFGSYVVCDKCYKSLIENIRIALARWSKPDVDVLV